MNEEHPPYQKHSVTSFDAATAIKPDAGTLREQVFQFLSGRGSVGATDLEMQELIPMNPSTQRPRRIELLNAERIVDTGEKRKTPSGRNATVWAVVRKRQSVLF